MSDVDDKLVTIPRKGDVIIAIGNNELCAPCKKLDEFMTANSKSMNIKFVSINSADFKKKYPQIKVIAIPKIIFMRDGKVIFQCEGYANGEKFKSLISDVYDNL